MIVFKDCGSDPFKSSTANQVSDLINKVKKVTLPDGSVIWISLKEVIDHVYENGDLEDYCALFNAGCYNYEINSSFSKTIIYNFIYKVVKNNHDQILFSFFINTKLPIFLSLRTDMTLDEICNICVILSGIKERSSSIVNMFIRNISYNFARRKEITLSYLHEKKYEYRKDKNKFGLQLTRTLIHDLYVLQFATGKQLQEYETILRNIDRNSRDPIYRTKLIYSANKLEKDKYSKEELTDIIKDMYLLALEKDITTIEFCPKEYIDEEKYFEYLELNPTIFQHIPYTIRNNNKDLCLKAFELDVNNIAYIPSKYQNEEMADKAIDENGLLLQYLPTIYRTVERTRQAVLNNPKAIQFI